MDYSLAKELRDAGFPQKTPLVYPFYQSGDDTSQMPPVYIPTLSELIEACKGRTIKLWILEDGRAGVQLEGQSLDDVVYYSTPEEAVARLWISLNKKAD